jgi:hypothetical protein
MMHRAKTSNKGDRMRRCLVGIAAVSALIIGGCGNSTPSNPDLGPGTDTTQAQDLNQGPDGVGQDLPVTPDNAQGQDMAVTPDVPPPPPDGPPPPPPDGGPDGVSPDGGPPVNCDPLDLTGAATIPIENATITPAGQGGTLSTSNWDLSQIKVDAPLDVTGTAQGKVEIVAADATTGAARIAVHGDITAPLTTTFDQTGAGDYSTDANMLNITGGCGMMSPIMNAQYTATATELTIWADVTVMGIPVTIELHLAPAQ